MSKRISKQIIITLIFILLLSGSIFLIWHFFQPAASCSDGIQNQNEEGIDCGGPCSPCDFVYMKDIEILWTDFIPIEQDFYDVVAQIRNPNQNYGSGRIPYQFNLYDFQNSLVGQYSGSTFILPNQTKYLIQLKIKATGSVNRVEISFDNAEWQSFKDYQPPQLAVQQKEYYLLKDEEAGDSRVKAVLINKSNFDFDKTEIDILLFDSFHQLLALNTTEIKSLLSGQERGFTVTWFNAINGQVSFVEAEAETNIFDSDNYIREYGDYERFQEY